MSLHDDLLSQAHLLATIDTGRPKQANLRRALSATYYALFHFLVDQSCGAAVGRGQRQTPYRRVLARAFDHATMKAACRPFGEGNLKLTVQESLPPTFSVSRETRRIATLFIKLQASRHSAEYNLSETYFRNEVLADIESVRTAIAQFGTTASGNERKFFLACLCAYARITERK